MCEGDTRLQRHYDSVSQTFFFLELMDVSMQSARSFVHLAACFVAVICFSCAFRFILYATRVPHKLNKLVKLFELCVCLILLLCCNHFTLMLYYRQHLCVALSAEACEMYLK